jgi:beta-lactamase class A
MKIFLSSRYVYFGIVLVFAYCQDIFTTPAESRLLKRINKLATATDGVLGVGAYHGNSGFTFGLNAQERFPMASTYKLPLALLFLKKIDEGKFNLQTRVLVQETDLRSGDSFLVKRYAPGMTLTYRDLLRLMIEMSDNTATDILFKAVGGPQAVTEFLKNQGLKGIDLNRTTLHLLADFCGVTGLPEHEKCTLKHYRYRYKKVNLKKRWHVLKKFYSDEQDTATPTAMTQVLKLVETGRILKPETLNVLLDSMRLCQTGPHRISSQLPGTAVAQKTGSLCSWTSDPAVANDVALITMPDGSTLLITIFLKKSTRSKGTKDKIIARSARLIYDHVRHHHMKT